MPQNITKAQITDVAEAVVLVNSAYRGNYSKQGWTSESHLLEGIRIDEAEMAGYFDRPEITLLKHVNDAGRITGFVYLEQVANNRLYLGLLTVEPTQQDAGVGRQLLAAANDVAQQLGAEAVKISVITTRTELIAWYQRRGFTATGQTYPLVTDKSVAIEPVTLMVMEKRIVE